MARVRAQLVDDRSALEGTGADGALAAMSGSAEARLLRSGADLERERARLGKELERARAQLAQVEARLADEAFTARAPASVVDSARQRAAELRELVARLTARMAG